MTMRRWEVIIFSQYLITVQPVCRVSQRRNPTPPLPVPEPLRLNLVDFLGEKVARQHDLKHFDVFAVPKLAVPDFRGLVNA